MSRGRLVDLEAERAHRVAEEHPQEGDFAAALAGAVMALPPQDLGPMARILRERFGVEPRDWLPAPEDTP